MIRSIRKALFGGRLHKASATEAENVLHEQPFSPIGKHHTPEIYMGTGGRRAQIAIIKHPTTPNKVMINYTYIGDSVTHSAGSISIDSKRKVLLVLPEAEFVNGKTTEMLDVLLQEGREMINSRIQDNYRIEVIASTDLIKKELLRRGFKKENGHFFKIIKS